MPTFRWSLKKLLFNPGFFLTKYKYFEAQAATSSEFFSFSHFLYVRNQWWEIDHSEMAIEFTIFWLQFEARIYDVRHVEQRVLGHKEKWESVPLPEELRAGLVERFEDFLGDSEMGKKLKNEDI